MYGFQKAKKFVLLDRKTMFLLLEAFICLGCARLFILLPFSRVAPFLGIHMEETAQEENQGNTQIVKNISHAIHIMSRYTFWESKCLVRALAGMNMLGRRKIDSTLYLGTAREVDTRNMIAHAWLRTGSYYVTGKEEMRRFTVVSKFAKRY